MPAFGTPLLSPAPAGARSAPDSAGTVYTDGNLLSPPPRVYRRIAHSPASVAALRTTAGSRHPSIAPRNRTRRLPACRAPAPPTTALYRFRMPYLILR